MLPAGGAFHQWCNSRLIMSDSWQSVSSISVFGGVQHESPKNKICFVKFNAQCVVLESKIEPK